MDQTNGRRELECISERGSLAYDLLNWAAGQQKERTFVEINREARSFLSEILDFVSLDCSIAVVFKTAFRQLLYVH